MSCETGMQTRKRSCYFESQNITAQQWDSGCSEAYPNKYYEEKECNTQPCRMSLFDHSRLNL